MPLSQSPWQQLSDIEVAVHKHFGVNKPSKKEVAEYITKKFPKMEFVAIAALVLAAAAFIVQVYDSNILKRAGNDGKKCPKCGRPPVKVIKGKLVCAKEHKW